MPTARQSVTQLANRTLLAEAALQVFRERRPDVIASDIRMPGTDGCALLRETRAIEEREKWPRTPAVAITAFTSAADRTKAEEAGFDDHLAMPLDPQKLIEVLERLTKRK